MIHLINSTIIQIFSMLEVINKFNSWENKVIAISNCIYVEVCVIGLESNHTHISGLDLFFHLYSYLSVMLNHSLFVLLAIKVLPSCLRRAVLQENTAILTVKLFAHNYNRFITLISLTLSLLQIFPSANRKWTFSCSKKSLQNL